MKAFKIQSRVKTASNSNSKPQKIRGLEAISTKIG